RQRRRVDCRRGPKPAGRHQPSAPAPVQRNADLLVGLRKRQLDDLHRDRLDALVLEEQRLADMVGDRLDQLEMRVAERLGTGELEVHVILAGVERGFRVVVRDRLKSDRDRKTQWLGPAGFLGKDAGVDHVLEVGELESEAVGHWESCCWWRRWQWRERLSTGTMPR